MMSPTSLHVGFALTGSRMIGAIVFFTSLRGKHTRLAGCGEAAPARSVRSRGGLGIDCVPAPQYWVIAPCAAAGACATIRISEPLDAPVEHQARSARERSRRRDRHGDAQCAGDRAA